MSDALLSVFGKPAPREEDVLFGPASDWHANACISPHGAHWAYSHGFRSAALHLAQHVCGTGREQDTLLYPIVYLYRHHAELLLKSIIVSANELLERELSKDELKAMNEHGLAGLWNIARPLLAAVCQSAGCDPIPEHELRGADSYIRQLEEHDPDGTRFRYSTTKAKKHSLGPTLTHVNIRAFAEAMERFANYLEDADAWLLELIGALADGEEYV